MLCENVRIEGRVVLITGVAGFIGYFLTKRLLSDFPHCNIVGVDSVTGYYDVRLKQERLNDLSAFGDRFRFVRASITDKGAVDSVFRQYHPSVAVNLAAEAGARNSVTAPDAYIETNIVGFYNLLEACCRYGIDHFLFASSSSVYGTNRKIPYSTDDRTDTPVSLYGATKKCDELLAHAYSKAHGIPATGLRFFTVYGPCGRPDMAYFGFTDKLVKGDKIRIFNYGKCRRDFTYIDDIVEGIVRAMQCAPERTTGKDGQPAAPFRVYNIGKGSPESLLEFVTVLQEELVAAGVLPPDYDFDAHKEYVAMQPGDVETTYADTTEFERDFGYRPSTPLREGLRRFARWYRSFRLQ